MSVKNVVFEPRQLFESCQSSMEPHPYTKISTQDILWIHATHAKHAKIVCNRATHEKI